MREWQEVTLADLCSRITSGGTPNRSVDEYFANNGGGHLWVKSKEVRNKRIKNTEETLTPLGLERSAAKLLPAPAVLVAMYGVTAGQVGFLEVDAAVNQAVCALVPDDSRVDPNFLFHLMRTKTKDLAAKSQGAAQQNLNAGAIKAYGLRVPPLAAQRRLGVILSAFDDLIEINERRIELLEDLVRSLYREWFVHFRFPGHEDIEMVDSELGPIPEGWSAGELGEIAEVVIEGVDLEDVRLDTRYIGLEHLPKRSTTLREWAALDTVKSRKLRFQPGDTLFGKIRPYFHKVSWASFDGVTSSDTVVFRAKSSETALASLVNAVASSDHFVAEAVAASNGTKMPRANTNAMLAYRIPVPSADILGSFGDLAGRSLNWAAGLAEQNYRLAATRDLLLPRLVTGQLDITDVDLGPLEPVET